VRHASKPDLPAIMDHSGGHKPGVHGHGHASPGLASDNSGDVGGDMCCRHGPPGPMEQSLDELDFERSICGAASRGDLEKVRHMLEADDAATHRDGFGYTALVGTPFVPDIEHHARTVCYSLCLHVCSNDLV